VHSEELTLYLVQQKETHNWVAVPLQIATDNFERRDQFSHKTETISKVIIVYYNIEWNSDFVNSFATNVLK
jgi:hypothetical protein